MTVDCLLHVVIWDPIQRREVCINQDGTTTADRDNADVWTNRKDAERMARARGAAILPAFDQRDDGYDD